MKIVFSGASVSGLERIAFGWDAYRYKEPTRDGVRWWLHVFIGPLELCWRGYEQNSVTSTRGAS